MKFLKRTASLVLCLTVLLGVCSCGKKEEIAEKSLPELSGTVCSAKEMLTAENENIIFSLNSENGNIYLTEKHTGRIWQSNPEVGYSDPYASGVTKTNLFSQLVVEYKSEKKGMQTTNSYVSSIKKNNCKIFKTEDGFRLEYGFSEGFKIPVVYSISDTGFNVRILYEYITEDEENLIHTINLLPYFGVANEADSGYLVIPDGSGAVINFNNGKRHTSIYEQPVYGRDEALPFDYETTRTEQIYVPVMGMKRNDGAFIAAISEGDGDAYIRATVSGQETAFNTVSFKAVYRAVENLSVLNGSLGTAGLVLYEAQNPVDNKGFCVEYSFLQDTNPDYNSMAVSYREMLLENGEINKTEDNSALFADFYGGVLKQKSFAGFPFIGTESLTTFKQAQEMLSALSEDCKNMVLGYKNYSKSYFDQTVQTDMTPSSALGSKKDRKSLEKYAENNGVEIYYFADFYSLQKSGQGYSKYSDSVKKLDLAAAKIYSKKLNTNIPDTSADPYYLLSPSFFGEAVSKVFNSADKNGIEKIYLGDISSKIAGDYSVDGIKRSRAAEILVESLKKEKSSLMLSSPNKYLWQFAEKITDIPLSSSGNKLFDYDIPFLQMLFKGSVVYAGNSFNLQNTSDDNILKSVAFAQNLHYSFMAEDAAKLQNTELISHYGLSKVLLENAAEEYKKFAEYYSFVKGAYINGWYLKGDVSETVFSNGCRVMVNYSEENTIYNGFEIPSRGYILCKEDEILLERGGTE